MEERRLQTETINRLADRIEQCRDVDIDDHEPDDGRAFTMRSETYNCGSPACILGHQRDMAGKGKQSESMEWAGFAADLGITHEQARDLCGPVGKEAHYQAKPGWSTHITARRAVAVLRHLRDTGEVDWTTPAADDSAA